MYRSGSVSPVESEHKLSWKLFKRYHTIGGIKVTIRKAKEDLVRFESFSNFLFRMPCSTLSK
jgi:hypothetical protein